ncbi:DUF1828 domain-containing protein [Comamonas odontotermitis]|uniref:DUF1828 domain-containing protein n=1 Tax=Comamonas TaxID=283 RepID=UPI0037509D37
MICQQISSLLGMACHPLDDAGYLALLETPFKFADGDSMRVFVEHLGNNRLRFFDDGSTLFHFLGRGVRINNGMQTRFLSQAAAENGSIFTDDGVIEVWADQASAPEAFAKYISTLLSLRQWEVTHSNVSHDAEIFVEEVAIYLAAWKGADHVRRRPKVTGLTGRSYDFDFDVDGTLVLAVSPHHASANAALHKLVDIRSSPENQGADILVVMEDRQDPKAAKTESTVLGAVSRVLGMRQLQINAGAPAQSH